MTKYLVWILATTVSLPSLASAQATNRGSLLENAANTEPDTGEIIVTARRREERLSDVPATIVALGAEALKDRGIQTEADLQLAVPGLTLRDGNTSNQFNYAIRGQTVDAFTSSQPGVLPYINEVQISSNGASVLYDLASVQALKGPQGTLFGRNATGGAVLYETARPTEVLEGGLTARLGNYDRRELEGVLNLPLVDEKVLLRVAGSLIRKDGYIRNLLTGETLGDQDSESGRLSLTVKPSDAIRSTSVFQYYHMNGTTVAGPVYSYNECGSSAAGLNDSAACFYSAQFLASLPTYTSVNPGTSPGWDSLFAMQQARGPFEVQYNSPSFIRGRSYFATNHIEVDVGDNVVLKNIAGYNNSSFTYAQDGDRTPLNLYTYGTFGPLAEMPSLTTGQLNKTEQWSEELQLQGTTAGGDLKYILGGYYSYQSTIMLYEQTFFDFSPDIPGAFAVQRNQAINRTQAVFGQATLDLSRIANLRGVSVTGGLRYTWEQVKGRQLSRSALASRPELRSSADKPSWIVGVDYKASPELLLYAVHRGSFRSGGINTTGSFLPGTAATGGAEFAPETTTDVEVGAKWNGRSLGFPVRANIGLFRQQVENVQRASFALYNGAPAALTVNVPKAVIKGIEFDGEVRPASWLTLGGAISYIDARFTKNVVIREGVAIPFGPYPDTPKWSGTAYVELSLPVSPALGGISVRGDLYKQSGFYFSSTNNTITPGTRLPGYETVNLRLSWSDIGRSPVSVALFATNVFDKTYYTGGVAIANVFGYNVANPGRPRSYGAEATLRF